MLISFAIITKLICASVLALAYCWFSYAVAHILLQRKYISEKTLKYISDNDGEVEERAVDGGSSGADNAQDNHSDSDSNGNNEGR